MRHSSFSLLFRDTKCVGLDAGGEHLGFELQTLQHLSFIIENMSFNWISKSQNSRHRGYKLVNTTSFASGPQTKITQWAFCLVSNSRPCNIIHNWRPVFGVATVASAILSPEGFNRLAKDDVAEMHIEWSIIRQQWESWKLFDTFCGVGGGGGLILL